MSRKLNESESLIDQHISNKSNKLKTGVTLTRVSQISNSMFPRARSPGTSNSRPEIAQTSSTTDLARAFDRIKADPSSDPTMSGRAKTEGCLSSSVTTSGSLWVSQQPDTSPTQGFSSNQSHHQPIIHPASNLFNIHRSHESIDSHVDDIQIPKLAVIPRKGNLDKLHSTRPEESGFMEELSNMFSLIEERLGSLPQLSIARVDPLSQVFSLRWNNHQSNLLAVFDQFLQTEAFCDVTLACDGASIKCHKMVLAACSNYFEKLFMENSCEHPIVFLKEVKAAQVQVILDYMYKGEVSLAREELPGLLHLAELLRVKGLVEEDTDKMTISKENNQRSPMPGRTSITTPDTAPPSSNGESGLHTSPSSVARDPTHLLPTSAPPSPLIPHFRPFLRPPGQGPSPPFPMWPLPGLMPGAHNLFHPRHDMKDMSPGLDWGRAKLPGFPPGRDLQLPPLIPREREDQDKPGHERHNGDSDHSFHKPGEGSHQRSDKSPGPGSHHGYESNQISPGKLEGIAGYVPTQRLEWKRYKQYTRSDIMAAIEEVKKGMSALQASRKFGVPSRTLYDKVKKMGITTGRQQHRKHMPGNTTAYSAAFPGINLMSPLSRLPDGISMENQYQDLIERMKEADDNSIGDTRDNGSRPEEGVDPTARGPMPPILPPQMLNMMKQIKGQGEAMNLTSSQEREGEKGMSDGHIAQSTSPSSREMTSPANRSTNSPRDYHKPEKIQELDHNRLMSSPIGGLLARDASPHHIDIRARFLADLSRLAGGRPLSPQIKQEGGGTPDENLPPRKRKVSQDVEEEQHGKMLIQEKNLNGMHDGEGREHTDGSSSHNVPVAT